MTIRSFALMSSFLFILSAVDCGWGRAVADDKCYHLHSANPLDDDALDKICHIITPMLRDGNDGSTYMALKRAGCEATDMHRYFIAKSAAEWQFRDFADAVKAETECRDLHSQSHIFDPPGSVVASEVLVDVVGIAGPLVKRAKEQEQQRRASDDAMQERQRAADQHVAELESEGFRPFSVSDLQLSGRDLIGRKVVVRGYVTLFSDAEARIYTHKDDLNGVFLDVAQGPIATRRFILENCSRLGHFCRMEIKGIVVMGNGGPKLQLAD